MSQAGGSINKLARDTLNRQVVTARVTVWHPICIVPALGPYRTGGYANTEASVHLAFSSLQTSHQVV